MPILFPLTGPSHGMRNRGIPALLLGRLPLPTTRLLISGVTKDDTGAASGGFTVYLFNMTSGVPILADSTVSDGSGNYTFSVGPGMRYWAVDYKAGTPDKAGATVNTLTGV